MKGCCLTKNKKSVAQIQEKPVACREEGDRRGQVNLALGPPPPSADGGKKGRHQVLRELQEEMEVGRDPPVGDQTSKRRSPSVLLCLWFLAMERLDLVELEEFVQHQPFQYLEQVEEETAQPRPRTEHFVQERAQALESNEEPVRGPCRSS